MYAQVEKHKENKRKAVSGSIIRKESSVKQRARFTDNRSITGTYSRMHHHESQIQLAKFKDGETEQNYTDRKTTTADLIRDVSKGITNASAVHCVIFSQKSGKIFEYHPVKHSNRGKNELNPPNNPYVYTRDDLSNQVIAERDYTASKDGEIYLLSQIETAIDGVINTRANINNSALGDESDVFRIEIVGPRATCADCLAALRQFAMDKEKVYPKVKIEIKTRWTGGDEYEPNQRLNSTLNQSGDYGDPKAYSKSYIKGTKTGVPFPAAHKKLNVY